MPLFEITYSHPWRDVEHVEADEIRQEGRCLVFTCATVVVDSPRTVVLLRVPLGEVASVRRQPPG